MKTWQAARRAFSQLTGKEWQAQILTLDDACASQQRRFRTMWLSELRLTQSRSAIEGHFAENFTCTGSAMYNGEVILTLDPDDEHHLTASWRADKCSHLGDATCDGANETRQLDVYVGSNDLVTINGARAYPGTQHGFR